MFFRLQGMLMVSKIPQGRQTWYICFMPLTGKKYLGWRYYKFLIMRFFWQRKTKDFRDFCHTLAIIKHNDVSHTMISQTPWGIWVEYIEIETDNLIKDLLDTNCNSLVEFQSNIRVDMSKKWAFKRISLCHDLVVNLLGLTGYIKKSKVRVPYNLYKLLLKNGGKEIIKY